MSNKLVVKEAEKKDMLRQIAQISIPIAEKLGIKTGDVIEIRGSNSTYVRAWRSSSLNDKIIKLDPITRKNAGTQLNETVEITKSKSNPAESIEIILPEDMKTYESFISKYLRDRLVCSGDYLRIELGLGKFISTQIVSTTPLGPVICNASTIIQYSNSSNTHHLVSTPAEPLQESNIYFADVGGLDEIISKIREMVEYPLKYPKLFLRLGVSPPKGLLLYGPPGTGKTLLAKAIASETNSAFFIINGPEIVSKYYGESENKLRDIFLLAKQKAPSVIFIDEIDSIAPNRSGETGEAERRLVSQLLTLMDGLETRGEITVIAATNRQDAIDPALRRGGRFDREIYISPPNATGRLDILLILTRGMPLASDVDLSYIADRTHGFVGADLSILVKETALRTLKYALANAEKNNISIDKLHDTLKVCQNDFLSTMTTLTPSGMRNIRLEKSNNTWQDIAGLEEIKNLLLQAIEWPFLHKELYSIANLSPPRGILLYGPPGNGKTMIAKALANESKQNFISINSTDILSKYVGDSEKAIHEIFMKAKLASPCIIFIDEIDAIISKRSSISLNNASLTGTLLIEMDETEHLGGIVVLAATNRPDLIDPALLRPGRFDKLLYVPNPDTTTRKQLIKNTLQGININRDVDLNILVTQTEGYSAAEILLLLNTAKENRIKEIVKKGMKPIKFTIYDEDIQFGLAMVKPRFTNYDLALPTNQSINYM